MQAKNLVRTRITCEGRGPRREYVKFFYACDKQKKPTATRWAVIFLLVNYNRVTTSRIVLRILL